MPKIEKKPDLKPIQMEAKTAIPAVKQAKPAVISPPAQSRADCGDAGADAQAHPSTAPSTWVKLLV
jgi:hypothetical protein